MSTVDQGGKPSPWRTVIAAFLAARAVLAVAWVISGVTWFGQLRVIPGPRREGLLLYDGTYYRDLVEHGYSALLPTNRRFFPGYHLLARAVSWLTGGHTALGLIVVSNVAALIAMYLLYQLVMEVADDRSLARRSVWALALFPAGAVLVFAYGESLALALSIAAVLAARRERFAVSILLGIAAGLCRPTAAFLVVPLLGAAWPRIRLEYAASREVGRSLRAKIGFLGGPLLAAVSPLIGLTGYLVWLQLRFGSWREPIDAQRAYRAGWHEPVTRLVSGLVDLAEGNFRDVYNVGFALVTIVALAVVALVIVSPKIPWSWWAYVVVTLAVALAANNINSLGRYVLSAFSLPVIIAVADRRLAASRPWIGRVLLGVSAVLACGYGVAAWSGRMIP